MTPQQADSIRKHSFDAIEPQVLPDTGSALKVKEEKPDTARQRVRVKKKEHDAKKEREPKKEQAREQASVQLPPPIPHPEVKIKRDTSLFAGHQLQIISKTDKIHFQDREYWLEGIVLLSLLILVWARNVHAKRFTRISKAFFNIREFYQVVKDEYAMTNSLSIGLILLFVLIVSVFIYQLNAFYSIFPLKPGPIGFYLKIVVMVLLFTLVKLLTVNMLGSLFYGRSEKVTDFVYNIFLMNNINGIVLIPIVIFTAYFNLVSRSAILAISSVLLVSIYLYRMLRAFEISSGEGGVSRMYFFAYLCTLEVLPFVVIVKVITGK
jgi:hypothetical protein